MLGPVRTDSAITLDESLRCCEDNPTDRRAAAARLDHASDADDVDREARPEIDPGVASFLRLRKESDRSQMKTPLEEELGQSVPELTVVEPDTQDAFEMSGSVRSLADDDDDEESQTTNQSSTALLEADAKPKPVCRQATISPAASKVQLCGMKEPTKVVSLRDIVREDLAKELSASRRSRGSSEQWRQDSAPSLGASIVSRGSKGEFLGEASERSAAPKPPQRQMSSDLPEDLGISNETHEDKLALRKPQRQASRDDVTAFDELNFESMEPVPPPRQYRRRRSLNDLQALLNRSNHSGDSFRPSKCLQLSNDDNETQESHKGSMSPRSRAAPKRESGLVDDVRSVNGHQSLNGLSALTGPSKESRAARRSRRRRKKSDAMDSSRKTSSTAVAVKKPSAKKENNKKVKPFHGSHSTSQLLDEAWVEKWLDSREDGSTSSASSFSSGSTPFQWRGADASNAEAGHNQQQTSQPQRDKKLAEDQEDSSGRAPVEYVIVDSYHKSPTTRKSQVNVVPRPPPIMIEASHGGTRTTVDADSSLTWAYDPNSGVYRMVQIAAPSPPWLCSCGQENDCEFNFCGMCATPQRWTCSQCNFQKNKCRFPHCGGCGAQRKEKVDIQSPRPAYIAPGAIY